jgi:hypothetical protein
MTPACLVGNRVRKPEPAVEPSTRGTGYDVVLLVRSSNSRCSTGRAGVIWNPRGVTSGGWVRSASQKQSVLCVSNRTIIWSRRRGIRAVTARPITSANNYTLGATVRMKQFSRACDDWAYRQPEKSGGRACTNKAALWKERCLAQAKEGSPTHRSASPPRHSGSPMRHRSRSVALSPCAHADSQDDSSTRPSISAADARQLATSKATLACCAALPAACVVTILLHNLLCQHEKAPGQGMSLCPQRPHDSSHASPWCRGACSRQELLHVVSLLWQIISGIKGRLGFPLWNAHAAAPDSSPLLRPVLGWLAANASG